MLENYEIKVLEHDLSDYNAWAEHAVTQSIFSNIDEALYYKAKRCTERMIAVHESQYSVLSGTIEEKINIICAHPDYKDRVARDAELL